MKCAVILSVKSSGSSALQQRLVGLPGVRHVDHTHHKRFETLYWTKAASVLQMDQIQLPKSEVPLKSSKAKVDLIRLLKENLGDYHPPEKDVDLIRDGWRRLCQAYQPVFLEKSPHHLYQWSALYLMNEFRLQSPDIDFLFIGLVRNPMDTLYSMWERWRINPESHQFLWQKAYENLLKLQDVAGHSLVITRYEDIIESDDTLEAVYAFIGHSPDEHTELNKFHGESLKKWRDDPSFGFQLSDDVTRLAHRFGYEISDLTNERTANWQFTRKSKIVRRAAYDILLPRPMRSFLRSLVSSRHI